jgi:hypothetical protein
MADRHWLLALAALSLAAPGCAMCQNTYDYCGPVIAPDGQMCDFRARRGSILAGMPVEVVSQQTLPDDGATIALEGAALLGGGMPRRPHRAHSRSSPARAVATRWGASHVHGRSSPPIGR